MTMRFILCLLLLSSAVAFAVVVQNARSSTALFVNSNRRQWLSQAAASVSVVAATTLSPAPSLAAESITIETKTFVDPLGYFAITVPKNYFTLRRSAKGDLPDSKTGQGRRGSSIFTAGNMAKAEVIAVERYVMM